MVVIRARPAVRSRTSLGGEEQDDGGIMDGAGFPRPWIGLCHTPPSLEAGATWHVMHHGQITEGLAGLSRSCMQEVVGHV